MTDHELRERFRRYNRALNRADALIEEWEADRTPITRAEAAQMFSFVLALRGWEETEAQLRPTLRAVPTPPQPDPGPTLCAHCQREIENRAEPTMGWPTRDHWVHVDGSSHICHPERGADSPRATPN